MARRVITAREQYELAEPFLRQGADSNEWEQELLSHPDYQAGFSQPAESTPGPSPLSAVEPFHPDFKAMMDEGKPFEGGYKDSAWEDYHKSDKDADWWHKSFSSKPVNEGKNPVQHPEFVKWMNNQVGSNASASWEDYHAHPDNAAPYHELFHQNNAQGGTDEDISAIQKLLGPVHNPQAPVEDPLADWEKEMLGIDKIPDDLLDGGQVKTDFLKWLKGKNIEPAFVQFDPHNQKHVEALNTLSPAVWKTVKGQYDSDNKTNKAKTEADGHPVFGYDNVSKARYNTMLKLSDELGLVEDAHVNTLGSAEFQKWFKDQDGKDQVKYVQNPSTAVNTFIQNQVDQTHGSTFDPSEFAKETSKLFGIPADSIQGQHKKYKDMSAGEAHEELNVLLESGAFEPDEVEKIKELQQKYFPGGKPQTQNPAASTDFNFQDIMKTIASGNDGWQWDPDNSENCSGGLLKLKDLPPEEVKKELEKWAKGGDESMQAALDKHFSDKPSVADDEAPPKAWLTKHWPNTSFFQTASDAELKKWYDKYKNKPGNLAPLGVQGWIKDHYGDKDSYLSGDNTTLSGDNTTQPSPGLQNFIAANEEAGDEYDLDNPGFAKWFNENHPEWQDNGNNFYDVFNEYQYPYNHDYTLDTGDYHFPDEAWNYLSEWQSDIGPDQLHEWINSGDDDQAAESFKDYLDGMDIYVGDSFDKALALNGLDSDDYGSYPAWKDSLPHAAMEYFKKYPGAAEDDIANWTNYQAEHTWEYTPEWPGAPWVINYDGMDVDGVPEGLTDGWGNSFAPGVGAFLLYNHPDIREDYDINQLDDSDWHELESKWNNLDPDVQKQFYEVQRSGQHPMSDKGKKLLQNKHQQMVTSPAFKAWFKADNSGADLDHPPFTDAAKMLYDEPDNDWTKQKIRGFQNYQEIRDDPDFLKWLKDNNYDNWSNFNLSNPDIAIYDWKKAVQRWHEDSSKPAPYDIRAIQRSLERIDPEFWDSNQLHNLEKKSYGWNKKNMEALVAQGENGDFPPAETALYKKLLKKYFHEEDLSDDPGSRPVFSPSYRTPKSLQDHGDLREDFQDWLWENRNKSLSAGQVVKEVGSWSTAEWLDAEKAFNHTVNPQTATTPAADTAGSVPFTGGVDWAREYMEAVDWNGPSPEHIHAGGAKFKDMTAEEAKAHLEKNLSSTSGYSDSDKENLQKLYDKYFGSGASTTPPSSMPDFPNLISEIANGGLPITGERLQQLYEDGDLDYEIIRDKLVNKANGGSTDDSQNAKAILNKYFGGIDGSGGGGNAAPAASAAPSVDNLPGLGGGDSGILRKPPTIEREIKKQIGRFIDKLRAPESESIYNDDDIKVARSEEFQRWFAKAPEDYRKVIEKFPYIAFSDFQRGTYGETPAHEGDPQVYKLRHYPKTKKDERGRIVVERPDGTTERLPEEYNRHWPGWAVNPEAKRDRPHIPWEKKPPSVPGQLEIPLGGGSSWEPDYKPPTMRRGIYIDYTRYNPKYEGRNGNDYDKLELQNEEGQRHRAAAQMLNEIRALVSGISDVSKKDREPTLFDVDAPELPEGMPEIKKSNSQAEQWMDLFAWGQKHKLTPEQMWMVAKKAHLDNPDKFGEPPLSYFLENAQRNPAMMARQVSGLIGDDDWMGDDPSSADLADVSRKLQRVKNNNDYGEDHDPVIRAKAEELYQRWFGDGLLNKLLQDKILDYITASGWKPSEYEDYPGPGGMGPHWTTHPKSEFGHSNDDHPGFPIEIEGDWMGLGEDYDRKDGASGYPHENELTVNPGAPFMVRRLKMRHPNHSDPYHWIDLKVKPHVRYATVIPVIPEVRKPGRSVLTHRERYADWDDWDDMESPMDTGAPMEPARPQMSPADAERLQHRQRPDGSYVLSPNALNPPSNSPSRPDIQWQDREHEQPTLTEDAPKDRYHQPLFRGVSIDLSRPEAADLHRMIFGHHPEDNYLFPHDRSGVPRFDHPELGNVLLNYLENHRPREDKDPLYGIGPHWTLNPMVANEFALSEAHSALNDPHSIQLPVRVRGGWKGLGEDSYRSGTAENEPGEWSAEDEMTLLPGAPLKVDQIQVRHPHTRQWIPLTVNPQLRQAEITPVPARPRNAKRIVSQREMLEG